jgi:hypothetical protein
VGKHRRAGEGVADVGFDAFQEAVAPLNGPVTWDQHVERDEPTGSSLMSAEGVDLHPSLGMLRERCLQRPLVLDRERRVHQPGD